MRQKLSIQPVFLLEIGDTGEMLGVAADKAKIVGHGDGGDFEICQGKRGSGLFQVGPETAADIGRLCIKTNDVDRRQEDFLQIFEMETGPVAFMGAVNDFRDGNSTDELVSPGQ